MRQVVPIIPISEIKSLSCDHSLEMIPEKWNLAVLLLTRLEIINHREALDVGLPRWHEW